MAAPTKQKLCREKIAAFPSEPADPARYEPSQAAFATSDLGCPPMEVSKALSDLVSHRGFLAVCDPPASYIRKAGRPPTFYRVTDAGRAWLAGEVT